MCCQPPVKNDDIDFFYEKNMRLIDSAPVELPTIGITGGEPTLLGERLFDLIAYIRKRLPNTHIQILSNGRKFAESNYAGRLTQVSEGMVIVGGAVSFGFSNYSRPHCRSKERIQPDAFRFI